jgi:hypothetical protein
MTKAHVISLGKALGRCAVRKYETRSSEARWCLASGVDAASTLGETRRAAVAARRVFPCLILKRIDSPDPPSTAILMGCPLLAFSRKRRVRREVPSNARERSRLSLREERKSRIKSPQQLGLRHPSFLPVRQTDLPHSRQRSSLDRQRSQPYVSSSLPPRPMDPARILDVDGCGPTYQEGKRQTKRTPARKTPRRRRRGCRAVR